MQRDAIITGGAGFIGSHLTDRLMGEKGWRVTVLDNFDPFYPRPVKEANIAAHIGHPDFRLVEGDLLDKTALDQAFEGIDPARTTVVHLAAKAGVRPSIEDPEGYHRVNTTGTLKLLERSREAGVAHFILASSSSVYGEHPCVPWHEELAPLEPISPYAASKLAAEAFTRAYARLHGLPTTVLRFFTVYGPRQRPDLAIHKFFHKVLSGIPIQQFGDGSTRRDYTFVADIINGVRGAIDRPLKAHMGTGVFDIFNLGNSETVSLRQLIAAIEQESGRQATVEVMPEQPGDVPQTYAHVGKAGAAFGYVPHTELATGLAAFHRWYTQHAPAKQGPAE